MIRIDPAFEFAMFRQNSRITRLTLFAPGKPFGKLSFIPFNFIKLTVHLMQECICICYNGKIWLNSRAVKFGFIYIHPNLYAARAKELKAYPVCRIFKRLPITSNVSEF